MKKALLLSALLVPAYALSAIKLDIKGQCHGHDISKELVLENDVNMITYTHDNGIICSIGINSDDAGILYDFSIKKNEDGEEITHPVIRAEWGKEATLALAEDGQESEMNFSISIVATRVEDSADSQE